MSPTVRIAAAAAALVAFAAASPGALAAPPNGTYGCTIFMGGSATSLQSIGTLEIRGNTYRGFDNKGAFAPFAMKDGQITWSAGLAGLPTGWTILETKDARKDRAGKTFIEMFFASRGGSKGTIHCVEP